MDPWRRLLHNVLPVLMIGMLAASTSLTSAAEAEPTAEDDANQQQTSAAQLEHVELNLEEKYVDLEGEICLTAGILELVATVAHGKEHESVVAVKARPQHVHVALLLLNLEKGRPGRWELSEEGKPTPIEPRGDPVRISLIYENEEGEEVERPITDFVEQTETREPLPDDVFLFAGSHIEDPPDADPYYVADMTGELIALVSFNSEVLAWPQPASHANAQLLWQVNEDNVPELGTPVTLRLRPAEDWQGPDELPDAAEPEPDDASQN